MTTPHIIRPETISDYAAIAAVNAHAFDQRASEAVIVLLHRHRPEFDPDLSLVAVIDNRIVGHVLFSPRTVRLLGQDVPAVNLAPIAIEPAFQKQGIGGQLIVEGHRIARAKGFDLSVLLGHTTYYPRFGYRTRAYGSSQLRVSAGAIDPVRLEMRKPAESDIPALGELWQHEEAAVDFAMRPGATLLDWLSPNPAIQTTVYTHDGIVAGYSRIHAAALASPRLFLARDAEAARAMASLIAARAQATDVVLPLHPRSASAAAFDTPECQAWEAGMALSLRPNPFDEYFAQASAGRRAPGRVIWPAEFDLE